MKPVRGKSVDVDATLSHVSTNSIDSTRPTDQGANDEMVTVPLTISCFQVVRLLGRGAFGVVYLAKDPLLDRLVAIKVPRNYHQWSAPRVRGFIDEARKVAKLQHQYYGMTDVPEKIDLTETAETPDSLRRLNRSLWKTVSLERQS